MNKTWNVVLAALLALGLMGSAYAESPTYEDMRAADASDETTARPIMVSSAMGQDQVNSDIIRKTQSHRTVGKSRFQVETRFDYQVDSDRTASLHTYTFPTQLRYGLFNPLEIRVRGNMFTIQDTNASSATRGFGDLTFGTKWSIAEGGGLLPSLGMISELGLPTGSNNVSDNTLVPSGSVIAAWHLPWELMLDTNLGIDYPRRDTAGDRFARLVYGTAVHRALPILQERMSAFVEFAGAAPIKDGKTGPHQVGTGLGLAIRDNMRLDAFARAGLTKTAANFQTGLGFSWRL